MDDTAEDKGPGAPKPPQQAAAPPRRDKFASMAAKQQQENKPPPRDKFASMAAKQQEQQQGEKKQSIISSEPPRRGKFAKLAAAKQASATLTTTTAVPDKDDEKKKQDEILKKKMSQRDAVLQDLQQAEGLTWKLLAYASSTSRALSDMDFDPEEVSKTSALYRETLQQIHDKLTPHAHLVVPYRNHQVDIAEKKDESDDKIEEKSKGSEDKSIEQSDNNMYAARVDMRLAMERKEILVELLRLEKEENQTGKAPETTSSPVMVGDSSRKRQREE